MGSGDSGWFAEPGSRGFEREVALMSEAIPILGLGAETMSPS